MKEKGTGKRWQVAGLLTLAAAFLLGGAGTVNAAWMADPPFALGEGFYPDVARGPGQQIHVAWMYQGNVYYRNYSGSWGDTENIPMGGTSASSKSAPDVWADTNNVPHVVWGDDVGELYYTNRTGGSWSAPLKFSPNPDTSLYFYRDVRIAVASNGNRHVVFRRKNISNDRGEIYYVRYSGSWGSASKISEGTTTAKRPHIALDGSDALHVVWRQRSGPNGSYEVMYRKRAGGSWQPVIMATNTIPVAGEDPHVATDPSNNPHVSFPEATDAAYIEWVGGGFSGVEIVGTGLDPVIAVDDNGAKYIFWHDEYTVDVGSGWSAPDQYVAGADVPDVVGGSDRAHLVYKNGSMVYYVGIVAGGGPPPPDTTITVSSPNGGEQWQVGSSHNITWNTTGAVDEVDIHYSTDAGGTWLGVAQNIQNQGYYSWTVPDSPSDLCRVRVRDAADGDPSDMSNANFSITSEPPGNETVNLSSPNGGEWWQVGVIHPITWTSSENFDYVKIEYSTDSGQNWLLVTGKTANDGTRDWTVPNTPAEHCRVKISDWADGDPVDISNGEFTIGSGTPPAKSLTVYAPNGGEILEVGTPYVITWGHTGSVSDVALHYSVDNGGTWKPITGRTVNDHETNWIIPDENSTTCLVRIMEADTGDPADISDDVFTITPEVPAARLTLTSPNGGEVILAGSEASITWQSTGAIDSVKLHYSPDGGQNWEAIVPSYPNVGTYVWSVPSTPTSLAKVRVSDVIGGEATDESDTTFNITDDMTAPMVDTLYLPTPTDLLITFSEELDQLSAEAIGNYVIDNGVTVLEATLDPGGREVLLVTSEHLPDIVYTITMNGILDRATPPNPIAPNTTAEYALEPSGTGEGPEPGVMPRAYGLSQNFPNPFNPSTKIVFAIPEAGGEPEAVWTRLSVYNLKGKLVRVLVEATMNPGYHTVTWDGRDRSGAGVSSGVYLYRLTAGDFELTRKMILVK